MKSVNAELDKFKNHNPGPHVLYENVLNPYVKELLDNEENDEALQRIFKFYEDLAQSNDQEVKNLLQVTLLEVLWDDSIIYGKAYKYMLPATRQINDLIGEYFKLPT